MRSISVSIATRSREALRCKNQTLSPLVVILLLVMMCWMFMWDWVPSYSSPHPVRDPPLKEDFFAARNILLEEACRTYPNQVKQTTAQLLRNNSSDIFQGKPTEYQMKHMYVDVKHRIMYCYVPKVGCTNWKRIMLMLTGHSKVKDPLNIPTDYAHLYNNFRSLFQFNENERAIILQHYKKFIMVRHPFERLLSAYRNKFESNTTKSEWFHKKFGTEIIKALRPSASKESLQKGHDVTFLEFVQYLMNPEMSLEYNEKQSWNEHWESMNGLCSPCTIHYDYIGHFENLVEESNMILDKISPERGFNYPESKYIKTADTQKEMNKYYEQLPFHMIRKLRRIYDMDMHLFNYSVKDMLHFTLD